MWQPSDQNLAVAGTARGASAITCPCRTHSVYTYPRVRRAPLRTCLRQIVISPCYPLLNPLWEAAPLITFLPMQWTRLVASSTGNAKMMRRRLLGSSSTPRPPCPTWTLALLKAPNGTMFNKLASFTQHFGTCQPILLYHIFVCESRVSSC